MEALLLPLQHYSLNSIQQSNFLTLQLKHIILPPIIIILVLSASLSQKLNFNPFDKSSHGYMITYHVLKILLNVDSVCHTSNKADSIYWNSPYLGYPQNAAIIVPLPMYGEPDCLTNLTCLVEIHSHHMGTPPSCIHNITYKRCVALCLQ